MKKTTSFALCVLLLFGGLFCLHLTAQQGTLRFFAPTSTALLDLKIEETSERELLELKVAAHRRLVDAATAAFNAQSPSGTAIRMAETHANLAAALAELYRHTGEQDKLMAALKEKVEALTDKLRAVAMMQDIASLPQSVVSEAEVQLLDAMLELKRAGKTQDEQ